MGGENLEEEDYYHGLLPREDIPHLLVEEGDFLIRTSETAPNQTRQIIISILVEKRTSIVKHVVVQQTHGKFLTDAQASFSSVPQLIRFYLKSGEPILSKLPSTVLRRAVSRAPWELRHESVTIQKKIGEGAFGEVFKGTYKLHAGRVVDVAIKLAKTAEMTKGKIKEMMKEARLMRNYEHPNVVRMYGVCVEHEPLLIVMELVDGGALDVFLRRNQVPVKTKIEKIVAGSAWGLEYLHSRNCIHRDIAARNCLLTRDEYQMTKASRVPIKWLAPETIQRLVYTSKTDVWSYGVMIWEIFANAEEPYKGMSNAQVKEKVAHGYKMEFASEAPAWIVQLVHDGCWQLDPIKRSTMGHVAREIEKHAGLKPPVVNAIPGTTDPKSTQHSTDAKRRSISLKKSMSTRKKGRKSRKKVAK
ncbi:unnamed protein product [Thelazia callipaeda]|uniref:Tyrosine-protein kinase n=1 Tax=Thelazia callipaeda TaxID=103827 RepID=A0A0N5CNG7_THECL|nr:unnamed protein product [Thelazia callipaeda]